MTEARKRFFDIAEEVQTPNNVYTFTDKGKPRVVMMSAEEYESRIETMEVASIFPNLKKDVALAHKEVKSGNFATLAQLLAQHQPAQVRKPAKTKHVISRRNPKTRTKGSR